MLLLLLLFQISNNCSDYSVQEPQNGMGLVKGPSHFLVLLVSKRDLGLEKSEFVCEYEQALLSEASSLVAKLCGL